MRDRTGSTCATCRTVRPRGRCRPAFRPTTSCADRGATSPRPHPRPGPGRRLHRLRPRCGRPLPAVAQRGATRATAERVRARMLYHLARFYDEWPGENYDGSSCRGALKGWHKHGVCTEDKWRYDPSASSRPPPTGTPTRSRARWASTTGSTARRSSTCRPRSPRPARSTFGRRARRLGRAGAQGAARARRPAASRVPGQGRRRPCVRADRLQRVGLRRAELVGQRLGRARLRDPALRGLGDARHGRVGDGARRAGRARVRSSSAAAP